VFIFTRAQGPDQSQNFRSELHELHKRSLRGMSTAPSSRKRKRGLSDAKQPDSLSIELSSLPETQIGPVLGVLVAILEQVLQSLLI